MEKQMEPVEIRVRNIRLATITALPSLMITGWKFRNANICWIKTKDGRTYDIVFDEHGRPLTDIDLLNRISKFYNKTFQELRFEGRKAYGQIN